MMAPYDPSPSTLLFGNCITNDWPNFISVSVGEMVTSLQTGQVDFFRCTYQHNFGPLVEFFPVSWKDRRRRCWKWLERFMPTQAQEGRPRSFKAAGLTTSKPLLLRSPEQPRRIRPPAPLKIALARLARV